MWDDDTTTTSDSYYYDIYNYSDVDDITYYECIEELIENKLNIKWLLYITSKLIILLYIRLLLLIRQLMPLDKKIYKVGFT